MDFFLTKQDTIEIYSLKLIKHRVLTSHKQFSFSDRVINNWNELPDSVVLAHNLNMFKMNLDFFWNDKDFKYEDKKTIQING